MMEVNTMKFNRTLLTASFLSFTLALPAAADARGDFAEPEVCTPCAADLNGDRGVDAGDLVVLLSAWGQCDPGKPCPADLDGDGTVNSADLALLLSAWGPCPGFNYPDIDNPEAYQIAMEILGANGPLLPSDELVERVARDIDLIRKATPLLEGKFHTPAFQWDFLILSRNQSEDPSGYHCLNDFYGATIWAELEQIQMTILQFPGAINAPALAQIYAQSVHVNWAEASGIYGGENFWIPNPIGGLDGTWTWFVDDGFHDCFDGCDCHYYYWFSVSGDGEVTLLNFEQSGAPYCAWPY